jgi:hypothetical protein
MLMTWRKRSLKVKGKEEEEITWREWEVEIWDLKIGAFNIERILNNTCGNFT